VKYPKVSGNIHLEVESKKKQIKNQSRYRSSTVIDVDLHGSQQDAYGQKEKNKEDIYLHQMDGIDAMLLIHAGELSQRPRIHPTLNALKGVSCALLVDLERQDRFLKLVQHVLKELLELLYAHCDLNLR
jgi:hypothetical protein